MLSKNKGIFFAALSGFFFGFLGYFGISAMHAHISVPNMLFWRFFISSLFLFTLLVPHLNTLKIFSPLALQVAFYGIFFYGTTAIFYFIAAKYIGSGLAMVVFYTYPAMVMLINVLFYQQKMTKNYYLALIILFIGMLFLGMDGKSTFDLKGIILSLVSAFLYALYIITGKNCRLPALLSSFWICLGASLTCLITALFYDKQLIIPKHLPIWFNLGGISLLCTALPMVLLLKGLKHISSVQAAILSVLEPVFVVICGLLLLSEKIAFMQGVGIVILLSGALLTLIEF